MRHLLFILKPILTLKQYLNIYNWTVACGLTGWGKQHNNFLFCRRRGECMCSGVPKKRPFPRLINFSIFSNPPELYLDPPFINFSPTGSWHRFFLFTFFCVCDNFARWVISSCCLFSHRSLSLCSFANSFVFWLL